VKFIGVIRHVRAIDGVVAVRYDIEALQPHHVIDAHVRGVTKGACEHCAQILIVVIAHGLGVKRGKGPVLTARKEEVGW
jgi:hypothetical protein